MSRAWTRTLLALVVGALALACGSLDVHRVVTGPVGPPSGAPVSVYLDTQPPPTAFQEVAIVQAVGRGNRAHLAALLEGLKQEAASMGCDAVIRVRVDQGSSTASAIGVAVRTR
jgi:hypothetical protein